MECTRFALFVVVAAEQYYFESGASAIPPLRHGGYINNEAPTRIQERVHQRGDNGPFRRAVSSTPVMNSRRLP